MVIPTHSQFNHLLKTIRPHIETQYGIFGMGLCLGVFAYIHVWGTIVGLWMIYTVYQFSQVDNRMLKPMVDRDREVTQDTTTASISLHRYYIGDTTTEHEMVDAVIDYVCHLDSSKSLMYTRQFHLDTNDVICVDPTLSLFIQLTNKEFDQRSGDMLRMTLLLYSTQLTLTELRSWLEKVHRDYQQKHKDQMETKTYFFEEVPPTITHDIQGNIQWSSVPKRLSFSMNEFHTHKNFRTVFGNEVKQVKQRMDLFLYNKEFYEQRGKPHTLGLLLYGRPGCGKTSLIKAILKETGRHGITLKLKDYTTETQLDNLFHTETLMTIDPITGTSNPVRIPLNKRVYIIEDVDCLSSVVQQRSDQQQQHSSLPTPPTRFPSPPTKVDPDVLLTLVSEEYKPLTNEFIQLVNIGNGNKVDCLHHSPDLDTDILFTFDSALHPTEDYGHTNDLCFTHTANRYDSSSFGTEFQELTTEERSMENQSTVDKQSRNILMLLKSRSEQDETTEESARPLSPASFQRKFDEEVKRRTEEQMNEPSAFSFPFLSVNYTYGQAIDTLNTLLNGRKYVDYHFTQKESEFVQLLDMIEREYFIYLERNYNGKFVFVKREQVHVSSISQTQNQQKTPFADIEDCPMFQVDPPMTSTPIVDAVSEKVRQQQAVNGRGITLSYLLNLLDGIHEGDSRILIMTSNRPDVLDKALLRSGRVDLKIEFGYATLSVVREMFTNYFQHCPEASKWVSKILPAIDSRMSPADISEVLDRFWDQPSKAVSYLNELAISKSLTL